MDLTILTFQPVNITPPGAKAALLQNVIERLNPLKQFTRTVQLQV